MHSFLELINLYHSNARLFPPETEFSLYFRGYFSQGDQRYFIEPLSATPRDGQEHALFKDEPSDDQDDSRCGMDDVLWVPRSHQNVVSPATRLVVCTALSLPVILSFISS